MYVKFYSDHFTVENEILFKAHSLTHEYCSLKDKTMMWVHEPRM
jgi:hypothetical protein